jgi:hypothetical protein
MSGAAKLDAQIAADAALVDPVPEAEPEPQQDDADPLLSVVRAAREANPGMGLKKLVAEIKRANPAITVGTKEIRQAVNTLDAAAKAAEQPAAAAAAAAAAPAAGKLSRRQSKKAGNKGMQAVVPVRKEKEAILSAQSTAAEISESARDFGIDIEEPEDEDDYFVPPGQDPANNPYGQHGQDGRFGGAAESKIAPMVQSLPDNELNMETRQAQLDAQNMSSHPHDALAARARLSQKREDADLSVKNKLRQQIRTNNATNRLAYQSGNAPDLPGLLELVDEMRGYQKLLMSARQQGGQKELKKLMR